MAFSEAHWRGFSPGTPVFSSASLVNGFSQWNKTKINTISHLTNLTAKLSLLLHTHHQHYYHCLQQLSLPLTCPAPLPPPSPPLNSTSLPSFCIPHCICLYTLWNFLFTSDLLEFCKTNKHTNKPMAVASNALENPHCVHLTQTR